MAPLTGAQALRQMFDQRDAKRNVRVAVGKDKVKIGQDYLDFSVQSDRPGYVYVALAGSDNKSLYLLFPNDLDQNNKVDANQPLALPRANWRVKAQGPTGTNNLLVIVSDGPARPGSAAGLKSRPLHDLAQRCRGPRQAGCLDVHLARSDHSGMRHASSPQEQRGVLGCLWRGEFCD